MRENRPYGSEGGAARKGRPYPYQAPLTERHCLQGWVPIFLSTPGVARGGDRLPRWGYEGDRKMQ
jgi:hypothetical protein